MPRSYKTKAEALFRLMLLVAAVALLCGTAAIAQQDKGTKITLHANDETKLKEFSLQDGVSIKILGSKTPASYEGVARPNVKSTVYVFAAWTDGKEYKFPLHLYSFKDLSDVSVFFTRSTASEGDAAKLSKDNCTSISANDIKKLFKSFFLCMELATFSKPNTQTYFMAMQGWFNASYSLSRLGGTTPPYAFDEDILPLMNKIIENYNKGVLKTDIGNVIDVKDIQNKIKNVQIADVFLVNEVANLVNSGKVKKAIEVNNYVKTNFSKFQELTGTSAVEGVSMGVLVKNNDYLTKLPAGQI